MTETAERYVEAHGQYSFTAFQKSNYHGSANVKPFGKAEKYSGKVSEQKSKEELNQVIKLVLVIISHIDVTTVDDRVLDLLNVETRKSH